MMVSRFLNRARIMTYLAEKTRQAHARSDVGRKDKVMAMG